MVQEQGLTAWNCVAHKELDPMPGIVARLEGENDVLGGASCRHTVVTR